MSLLLRLLDCCDLLLLLSAF